MNATVQKFVGRLLVPMLIVGMTTLLPIAAAAGQPDGAGVTEHGGGEASLVLPDLSTVDFHGVNGRVLLMGGLVVCALGLLFGLMTFTKIKNPPDHPTM